MGLDNYVGLFGGSEFWGVLFNTFYFMVAVVLGSVVLALSIALLLNQRLRGRNFVRSDWVPLSPRRKPHTWTRRRSRVTGGQATTSPRGR